MGPRSTLLSVVLAFAVAAGGSSHAADGFELAEDDVVVFVGGANMLRLQQAGHLEAALTREFASARPRFRDLSWEADTVFGQGTVIERWRKRGHGDLDAFGDMREQLEHLGATVVIAQFGRLESLAGAEGLPQFAKAYRELVDQLHGQARRVVLVTPTPFEKPPSPLIPDLSERNEDLALYVKEIARIAADRELVFVDLFSEARPGLTGNGMHVKAEAQVHVSEEIVRQLGLQIPDEASLEPLRKAVIEKHRLWYDYWRPANWKLLYGDDSARQFTRGGKDHVSFKEEWKKLLPLIGEAEKRVWRIARGENDPGHGRPEPESLHGDPNANIATELASFSTSDGLQVNLFASEREGLTSPLAIRWDPAGRMYVTVTTTYPHVFPGDLPNDKIIVLEDTDDDGTADKSTVFADGLNIPTGLELGDGGVYVGQNTELLFLQDTDGDGKADVRRVVLGGFGNGDSHQTINSFVWSPDGELLLGHGDGCESRVETPWGVSNLFSAGFYRLRPRRLQLLPFLEGHMGPGNPWGTAFDAWGQIFSVDGAGGVNWLSPALISTPHQRRLRRIGDPGGYCGIGYLDGRHLPDSMHGDFAVGDFKANRVKRFSVESKGAGYSLTWKEPILQSRHRNFRPVDVKVGPDGAIYVVDWYNPITCHQDDAYRDPTRDKAHGRIWRLSTKRPIVRPPDLHKAAINDVLESLKSPEHWTRYQTKRALTHRDPAAVAEALHEWVRSLDPKQPQYEHYLYEALGAYATIETVEPVLLGRLLQAQKPSARAFATRIVGRWHDRLDNPLELLAERIVDEHPQVRMEAVVACAAIPSPRSIEVASRAVDRPMDEWITYALKQTIHCLKPWWMPALRRGELSFARPDHLAIVLNEAGGREILGSFKELIASAELDAQLRSSVIAAILAVGDANDLREYGLDEQFFVQSGKYDTVSHAAALAQLVEIASFRDVRPAGDLAAPLNDLIRHANAEVQSSALRLAGRWKVDGTRDSVRAAAKDESLGLAVRAAAFEAMVGLGLTDCREILVSYAGQSNPPKLRSEAIQSLAAVDLAVAATQAALLFDDVHLGEPNPNRLDPTPTLVAILKRAGGADALAAALQLRKLKPATAKTLLRAVYSTGRSDRSLIGALALAIGPVSRPPDYDEQYVNRLAADALKRGNAERGAVLFKSMACSSCHKVGGSGGDVGPDLSAIGTTLAPRRIIEEVLWPDRQIKEGFSVVQVLTKDGEVFQGYQRSSKGGQASGNLEIEELATGKRIVIEQEDIDERKTVGSAMPAGLTALLSQTQLLDLIQYLSDLGRIQ